jgi:hypothetical protein
MLYLLTVDTTGRRSPSADHAEQQLRLAAHARNSRGTTIPPLQSPEAPLSARARRPALRAVVQAVVGLIGAQ